MATCSGCSRTADYGPPPALSVVRAGVAHFLLRSRSEVEQMGPPDPPLAGHYLHGDGRRHFRRPGTGGACHLGVLRTVVPARVTPVYRPVHVRAAVRHQMAGRGGGPPRGGPPPPSV